MEVGDRLRIPLLKRGAGSYFYMLGPRNEPLAQTSWTGKVLQTRGSFTGVGVATVWRNI